MKSYAWTNVNNTDWMSDFPELPLITSPRSMFLKDMQQSSVNQFYLGDAQSTNHTNYTNGNKCFTRDRCDETIFTPAPSCVQDEKLKELGTVEGLQAYLPPSASGMLENLRQRKINLILLATSLEKNEMMKNLEDTLDCKTSCILPLTNWSDEKNSSSDAMADENYSSDQVSTCSDDSYCHKDQGDDMDVIPDKYSLKRKDGAQKDEMYWKRRKCNNDAARRSREAKKDRFVWMENRAEELGGENDNLEKHLKSLKARLSFLMELKNSSPCGT